MYTRDQSNEQLISTIILVFIFLSVFVGLAVPAEARRHATIAGGGSHSLGIRMDGAVVAWG